MQIQELRLLKQIIKMLNYHPLAIDSAAVYLGQRPFISLERYIDIFENKLKDTRPKDPLVGKDIFLLT
jgi:hypothetical protein